MTDRQKHQQTTVCLHCACARHKKAYRFFVLATECQDLETVLYNHAYILTNISIPHKAVVDEAVNCHSSCPTTVFMALRWPSKVIMGFTYEYPYQGCEYIIRTMNTRYTVCLQKYIWEVSL